MSKISDREAAFIDLVGISAPGEPEDYPEEVTLPEYVHAIASTIVVDSAIDHRERSVALRFQDSEWNSGRAWRGTAPIYGAQGSVMEASANHFHALTSYYRSPHLFVHSHPMAQVSIDLVDADIPLEDLNEEMFSWTEKLATEISDLAFRVPSPPDVVTTLLYPIGSVANLVVAESGHFLWVHNDLSATKGMVNKYYRRLIVNNFPLAKELNDAMEGLREVKIEEGEDFDTEEFAKSVLRRLAQTLSPSYVSYASNDINNPVLSKIETPNL